MYIHVYKHIVLYYYTRVSLRGGLGWVTVFLAGILVSLSKYIDSLAAGTLGGGGGGGGGGEYGDNTTSHIIL